MRQSMSLPYTRPAAFVSFNPPKQRPGERFFFRPPVVSTQSHSNRRRGHAHAHVAFLFRRPARESHVYLDIRRALVPSNDRRQREVLAAGLGGDQRAVVCIIIIVGVGAPRRRHYLRGVLSLSKLKRLFDAALKRSIDRSLFSFYMRVFFVRFFSNSTPHKSLLSVGAQ